MRLRSRKRADQNFATTLAASFVEQGLEKRFHPHVFTAKTREQKQWRRIGWTQQVLEQRGAVGVGPLQVIDVEHERLTIADAPQQLAQGRKRLASQGKGIRNFLFALRSVKDRVDLQHHRKQARQRQNFTRHQAFSLRLRQRHQVSG